MFRRVGFSHGLVFCHLSVGCGVSVAAELVLVLGWLTVSVVVVAVVAVVADVAEVAVVSSVEAAAAAAAVVAAASLAASA